MRILIDESGNFTAGQGISRTCCVAALVVPEAQAMNLLREFVELRTTWTTEREIESSELTDEQSIAALTLIGQYDVVAMIRAYDKLHHPPNSSRRFKMRRRAGSPMA